HPAEGLAEGSSDLLTQDVGHSLTEQRGPGQCQETLVLGPDVEVGSLAVELEDDVVEGADDHLQTLLALLQCGRDLVALNGRREDVGDCLQEVDVVQAKGMTGFRMTGEHAEWIGLPGYGNGHPTDEAL